MGQKEDIDKFSKLVVEKRAPNPIPNPNAPKEHLLTRLYRIDPELANILQIYARELLDLQRQITEIRSGQ